MLPASLREARLAQNYLEDSLNENIHEALQQLDGWLMSHRDHTQSPFHPIAGFLRQSVRDCAGLSPMSPHDYEHLIRCRTKGAGPSFLPSVDLGSVNPDSPIGTYINDLDAVVLDHMVHGHLIGLLAHLSARSNGCDFLDYGTGATCGLHGDRHLPMYESAGIDVTRVRFVGLDKFVRPANSVFPRATYVKKDLASFVTEDRFDLVSAHHVLEHVRDWGKLLACASRVLKRDGFAFLSFPTFGGFYDVVYRLLTKEDHVATFELDEIIARASKEGLELVLSAPYADPRMRFFWLPTVEETVSSKLQVAVYDLCVFLTAHTRLPFHHYGHYLMFRRV